MKQKAIDDLKTKLSSGLPHLIKIMAADSPTVSSIPFQTLSFVRL